ncbi:unnamed protein product, partial [Vitis vinifera]
MLVYLWWFICVKFFFHIEKGGCAEVLDLGAEILERCGGTFLVKGLWLAHSDMLVTCIPADAHHVMSTNFWNFPKGPEFRMMLDAFGNGLFISDLEDWSFHRRIGRALFNHQRFQQLSVDITLDKVENGLVPVLEHASQQRLAVDFQDLFQRFGLDATCALITGCDPKSLCLELPDVPFASAMEEAGKVIFLRHVYPKCIWKLQRWLGIGSERILIAAKKTLYDFAAEHVIFHAYAMGRMACAWGKDCLEFKPERWLTGKGRTKHEPAYKFLAFSAGPRICLGKEVAFFKMKAVAAAIMHNYHFQMVKGHRVVPTVSIVLHMKHGLRVNVKNKWA